MMTFAPVLGLLVIAAAGASSGADATPRKPNGKWIVNFADSQCIATRDYGSDGDPLLLALKAPPLGEVMQLNLIDEGRGGSRAEHKRAIIYLDGERKIDSSGVVFTPEGTRQRLFRMNLNKEQFAAVTRARTMRIQVSGELDDAIELSQIEPLTKILKTCVDDLRDVWRAGDNDPETPNPDLQESAVGDLSGLFSAWDYPAAAIRREAGGTVKMALLINEQGRVADCTVIESSGFAALDAQSCAVIKERARLKPAIGLDGKPVKSSHVQRVTWRVE